MSDGRRGYTPESNDDLTYRFDMGGSFAVTPHDISEVHRVTTEKFDEAQSNGLVIAESDLLRAKAVVFSSLEEPEILGWLEFTKTNDADTYTVAHEYEESRLHATYGGMIGLKGVTYEIGGTPQGDSKLEIVGFKPSLEDTEGDREYATAALEHDKDPFGIGQEATAFYIGEEQGLRKLSLNALHGILLGVSEGEPTIEITNLQRALKLLSGMALVTSPVARNLYLDIKFSEPVRPDTEHRIDS